MTLSSVPPHPPPPSGDPAPSEGGGAALLDDAALQRLRDLDPTGAARLLPRVIDAYLQSVDGLLAQLAQAQAAGDAAVARRVAHTLKSSSASVGALVLSRTCAETEAHARDHGCGPVLDGHIARLREELAAAVVALRQLREEAARE